MTLIKVKNLSKHFGEASTLIKALDNITLEIEPNEFTAIVGPSGSGKSTLLHIVGGLDHPTAGEVYLNNKNLSLMTGHQLSDFRRDHIGFIFQAYNLIPVLSAEENIEYVMLLQGVSQSERHQRVKKILEDVGLKGMSHRRPNQLSGGQQQRVAVARAMVSMPDLILADEPTANLDSKTGASLLDIMKQLNEQEGMTFVFSTHDQQIMDRAKRIVHLHDGKIAKDIRR